MTLANLFNSLITELTLSGKVKKEEKFIILVGYILNLARGFEIVSSQVWAIPDINIGSKVAQMLFLR
jgi:hypothetical protein